MNQNIAALLTFALAFVCSCGSSEPEDTRVPERLDWELGDCSIVDTRCIDLVQVVFFDPGCVISFGQGGKTRAVDIRTTERCQQLVAPVLTEAVRAATKRGSSCTGTPPQHFFIKYWDKSRDRLPIAGCSGEPYDTIRRVRETVLAEANSLPSR